MSVNSKMTALADEIRELSGTTTTKSIDTMTSDVEAANTEIAEQTDLLEQIAAALEGKASGGGGTILPSLSNPASASDILSGKEAIDGSGNKITGSIATVTQATPSVSIDANGKITATATQSAGYVSAGTKSGTKQLTTQAAKTITPSTSSQTAVAKNVYTTGVVTVGAIPSNYEDVGTETSAYTAKLTSLETAITALETELAGKASGGGGSSEVFDITFTSFAVSAGVYYLSESKTFVQASSSGTYQVLDGIFAVRTNYPFISSSAEYSTIFLAMWMLVKANGSMRVDVEPE